MRGMAEQRAITKEKVEKIFQESNRSARTISGLRRHRARMPPGAAQASARQK
jgi:hypothetical protein